MAGLKGFKKGGIHPPDKKDMTKDKAIERMPLPDTVRIPVNQHIGAPCKPVVETGDTVLRNQVVAKGEGGLTSVVHSPVSGEVISIDSVTFPGKVKGSVITVKNDKQMNLLEGSENERELTGDFNEFLKIIEETGIIGMGGAGFPAYCKLNPPEEKPCDTFIVNGAECEPYLNADYRIMIEQSDKLLASVSYILDATGMKRGIIGIEANKMDAVEKLRSLNTDSRIEIAAVKTRYPQGAEKQLIYALTRRTVPIRKLPFEVGVIVHNVGTCMAIYDAVKFNKPLTERVVTVSGMGIVEPKNLLVSVGTTVRDVIEFCRGLTEDAVYAINGGPMMGKAFDNLELPVTKTTSGLLFLTEMEVQEEDEEDCIRCSKCLDVCPMGLNPTYLMDVSKKRRYEDMDDVLDCIECGSCTYICPVNRDLAASIIKGKVKYTKYLKRSKNND